MNASLPPHAAEKQGDARTATPDVSVDRAARRAADRIAPLWPLKSFVAVNPLLGMAECDLKGAGYLSARALGARLTMPRSYYAQQIASGRIKDADIAQAIAELSRHGNRHVTSVERVRAEALKTEAPADLFKLPTLASLAERHDGTDWERFITSSVSNWAADFFDQGVAVWSAASPDADPWTSYRAVSAIDRSAELLGLKGARKAFADLPAEPTALLVLLAEELSLPEEALQDYFHRLLSDVAGWAAYARYRGWTRELRGEDGSAARQLLAIRAAWELVLFRCHSDSSLATHWLASLHHYTDDDAGQWLALNWTDLALQMAQDFSAQRELAEGLAGRKAEQPAESRPDVQAAFCIDVRSERFRRQLERSPELKVETIGFAGFFGLAVALESSTEGESARCPVLLEPGHSACAHEHAHSETRQFVDSRWARFQRAGVAGFSYVEALGLGYTWKLLKASLGLAEGRRETAAPELKATLEEKIALAEGLLRGMSLTSVFAPLVVLAGHGASTENNPYASALDCGACGGHAGDANSRIAVQILNDSAVRAGLIERGIEIPADTQFVAALHDTTTDEIILLDEEQLQPSAELEGFRFHAELAGRATRNERAGSLAEKSGDALLLRGSDWSQVRPEWGLAGCRAFIAAPRDKTRGIDLDGRTFLHEYEHQRDEEHAVLETILTAPLVVASWITMQYYGSTVDNLHFGSGDKTLHNVVSGIGVLEGVEGDLRTGLPMQSLHDGESFLHEPLRLMAVIAAPMEAIDYVIYQHGGLADLVNNGWIQMHALDDEGVVWRRVDSAQWEPVLDGDQDQAGRKSEAA
ncbi:MAG: DUF2309 domain-containing protein [Halieaceae bacterium]|jgi:uncharacterized protein YbcC (UPF0753/DUF2309 family)|nr:DUF2309 domain-containing protein [Halieaceae bacterium]